MPGPSNPVPVQDGFSPRRSRIRSHDAFLGLSLDQSIDPAVFQNGRHVSRLRCSCLVSLLWKHNLPPHFFELFARRTFPHLRLNANGQVFVQWRIYTRTQVRLLAGRPFRVARWSKYCSYHSWRLMCGITRGGPDTVTDSAPDPHPTNDKGLSPATQLASSSSLSTGASGRCCATLDQRQ